MAVDDLLDRGILHQQEGRIGDARKCYEAALEAEPSHSDALHLLALTFHAEGDYARAITLIREAILGDPEAAFYHHNLAEALCAHGLVVESVEAFGNAVRLDPTVLESQRRYIGVLIQLERFSEALAASDSALKVFPADDQILGYLGVCHRSNHSMLEAAEAFRNAVQAAPGNVTQLKNFALCLLALKDPAAADAARELARHAGSDAHLYTTAAAILVDTKHLKEAYEHARTAINLNPELGQANFLLGYCLLDFNMDAAAEVAIKKAVAVMPQNDKAFILLGMAANRLQRKDEALLAFSRALEINPKSIDAHANFGILQQMQGKNDIAFESFKIALELDGNHPQANLGMGILLHRRGKISDGERHLRQCLQRSPENAEAYAALGHNLAEQGRIEEGMEAAKRACELNPKLAYAHNNRLFFSLYDYRITAEERSAIHRTWGEMLPSRRLTWDESNPKHHRRLRVGYISADFRGHAVSFFIETVLERHNHAEFEIYCYSDVKETDLVTDRIRRWADHWVSIAGKTDAEVASQIDRDEIDVLVDLGAHTADGRLGVFAQRPAPVQVSYIGYPWSTGLPAMGYRISDPYLDPPGVDDQLYVESTVRVDGFWCYRPLDLCPSVAELPAFLGDPFTFGSFNNVSKLNDRVLQFWARILKRVPESRLMLKYKGLDDPGVAERILAVFEKSGVDRDRIDLFGLTSIIEHMAHHNHVDLGLDPFPFNGGTTTFHSVYMGVPVIALEGHGHAERMSAAILRHVGLPEFIAKSEDEYVELAVKFANDFLKLRDIRSSLRTRLEKSPLMDAARHTHQLETAFLRMYEEQYARSEAPRIIRGMDPEKVRKTIFPSSSGAMEFSVIICGRDPVRLEKVTANFSMLFKDVGFELLYVSTPYSLAAGYNAAIKDCSADFIILCHDDIEILSPDAAILFRKYLMEYDVVGIAGTDCLVEGAWISKGRPHIFGQVAQPLPTGDGFSQYIYGAIGPMMPTIQAMDGLLLAVRRAVFEKIQFDEDTFDGFHLYDIDFTFAAYLAGFRLAIAIDLLVIHESGGNYDLNWSFYRSLFLKKYSSRISKEALVNPAFEQHYAASREKLLAMMRNLALGGSQREGVTSSP